MLSKLPTGVVNVPSAGRPNVVTGLLKVATGAGAVGGNGWVKVVVGWLNVPFGRENVPVGLLKVPSGLENVEPVYPNVPVGLEKLDGGVLNVVLGREKVDTLPASPFGAPGTNTVAAVFE